MCSNYETAQVCLNGHVITSGIETSPEMMQKFCSTCGKPTITNCSNCNVPIRGYHNIDAVVIGFPYVPPNFCHNCGRSFPWLEEKLKAAKELADEFENLDDGEKSELKQSFDDLVVASPRSELAISKVKRLLRKAGLESANALKTILTDIITEQAKAGIWGTGS